MSTDVFDGQVLAEKLSKLNNSQQSIQSLSQWCITHQKKAKQIVETWDKLFSSSQKEQCVSFLYLANDILQNSRRKGSEFVNEFWKVLPAALKHVYENGDESGKKAVTRLVGIWEERKVFGSRGQNLKGELLGKNPAPVVVNNVKSSNPIKIVKRDAHAVRMKLAVGVLPEKILTAFQAVFDDQSDEENALSKSNLAVQLLTRVAEEIDKSIAKGNLDGSTMLDELQQQESALNQCIAQLESAESTRADLIFQLKAALQEQESKVENIRIQMQVARGQIDQASNVRRRLTSTPVLGPPISTTMQPAEAVESVERNYTTAQQTSVALQPLPSQPVASFAPSKVTDEENKKAVAAAVAAKLAASTSSAQMLTSVLSSLVAEEAASRKSGSFTAGASLFPPEKRPKLENSMPVPDVNNSDTGNAAYFSSIQQQQVSNSAHSSSGMISQGNHIQAPFSPAPLPPLPSVSLANPPASQYIQSAGLMTGTGPYGYGTSTLPPPPPLPPHIAMSLARPSSQSQQQTQSQALQQQPQSQQQQQPPQQQQPATGGFYRPAGVGFYGQNHQSTAPPVPRH